MRNQKKKSRRPSGDPVEYLKEKNEVEFGLRRQEMDMRKKEQDQKSKREDEAAKRQDDMIKMMV